MANQADLVDIVHTLKQVMCVKGVKARPALVQVNAPLALIQLDMKSRKVAYEFALQLLEKVKP
jgi:hypothetical protein